MKEAALSLAGPLLRKLEQITSFYSEVEKGLQDRQDALTEVQRLRQENTRLAMENELLHGLEKENARLREMLSFKQESSFRLLPCKVVSRDPSSWWNTVLINRGWQDDKNLAKDLPVVTPRGLVGKTGVVSRYTTEVILIVDENCKVAANIGNTAQGIVVGEGMFDQGRPRARMKYIDRNAVVAVGEIVRTSGLGGVFPPGLPIGTVIEAPQLSAAVNFGLYKEAVIEPIVDLSRLNELFIIVGTK